MPSVKKIKVAIRDCLRMCRASNSPADCLEIFCAQLASKADWSEKEIQTVASAVRPVLPYPRRRRGDFR